MGVSFRTFLDSRDRIPDSRSPLTSAGFLRLAGILICNSYQEGPLILVKSPTPCQAARRKRSPRPFSSAIPIARLKSLAAEPIVPRHPLAQTDETGQGLATPG